MKDTIFNTKLSFLQQVLITGTNFLKADQEPSILRWLVAMRLLHHVHNLKKQIKAIALPAKIDNTPQYMQVMAAIDQLEDILDFLQSLSSAGQIMPNALHRAIMATKESATKQHNTAIMLIKPFDGSEDKPSFFQSKGQRAIWKSRNKNYVYLNLQPHRPEMNDLQSALAALED